MWGLMRPQVSQSISHAQSCHQTLTQWMFHWSLTSFPILVGPFFVGAIVWGVGPLTHSPPWIYPCIEESLFRNNFIWIWISLSVKLGCHPSSEWVVMHCLFSPSLFSYMTTWGKFKWIPSIAVLCPFQTVKLYPGDHGSGYKQRSKHHRVMYCMADRNRLFPANKKSKMCWNGTQTEELSASCSHSLRLNWSKDEFQRHLCAQLDSLLLFIGFSSH